MIREPSHRDPELSVLRHQLEVLIFAAADEARARVLAAFPVWLTTSQAVVFAAAHDCAVSARTLSRWAAAGEIVRTDTGRIHRESLRDRLIGTPISHERRGRRRV